MEGRRRAPRVRARWYRARGATDLDIDWAIQDARIVLQAMQMRANEVPRDRSMAENVKWILDHNPKAKIVLWAHNGHVATTGFSYRRWARRSGGCTARRWSSLASRSTKGSFQAMAQGGGGLKNFSVPPARAETLDGTHRFGRHSPVLRSICAARLFGSTNHEGRARSAQCIRKANRTRSSASIVPEATHSMRCCSLTRQLRRARIPAASSRPGTPVSRE